MLAHPSSIVFSLMYKVVDTFPKLFNVLRIKIIYLVVHDGRLYKHRFRQKDH